MFSSVTETKAAVPWFLIILPQLMPSTRWLWALFWAWRWSTELYGYLFCQWQTPASLHHPENDTCVLLLMLVIVLQQLLKTCEQVFPHLSALLQVCLCMIFSAQENSKAWLDVEGVQGLMGTVGEVQLSTGDLELHVIQNWWAFVSQGFFSLLEAAFQLITTAMSSKVTLCQAGGRESRFWMGPFKELRTVCAQMFHVGKDRCPGGDTHQVALSFQC